MPILNYTTSIEADKTIAEITKILIKHGANKIVTDYAGGLPSGITFWLVVANAPVAFLLPAQFDGVLNSMKKDPNVPNRLCTKEQALRVSWRIVKDWVEAQMAIVEVQVADMAEVFLPYVITPRGNTLYREIKDNGMKLLN